MNLMICPKQWRVSKEESGVKLLRFLQQKTGYSVRVLKKALECNLCHINGRPEHFGSFLLGNGDSVKFFFDSIESFSSNKSSLNIKILFEDDDFLFIEKPPGISSEDPRLQEILKADGKRTGLALAHRLDKETTGVLAFTLTPRAQKALYTLFKERKVSKTYFALVDGVPKRKQGRIENFLGRLASYQGQSLWGAVPKEKGSIAITEWKVAKEGNSRSLIACFPLTGRTHQIRVHLASIGHPILGDSLYNRTLSAAPVSRCLLHAAVLSFIHPFTNDDLRVESPLPPDFNL